MTKRKTKASASAALQISENKPTISGNVNSTIPVKNGNINIDNNLSIGKNSGNNFSIQGSKNFYDHSGNIGSIHGGISQNIGDVNSTNYNLGSTFTFRRSEEDSFSPYGTIGIDYSGSYSNETPTNSTSITGSYDFSNGSVNGSFSSTENSLEFSAGGNYRFFTGKDNKRKQIGNLSGGYIGKVNSDNYSGSANIGGNFQFGTHVPLNFNHSENHGTAGYSNASSLSGGYQGANWGISGSASHNYNNNGNSVTAGLQGNYSKGNHKISGLYSYSYSPSLRVHSGSIQYFGPKRINATVGYFLPINSRGTLTTNVSIPFGRGWSGSANYSQTFGSNPTWGLGITKTF